VTTPTFPIAIDKTITNIEATSGTFTLTLSDVNGLLVGSTVDIGGLPTAAWNTLGETLTAVNATTKTVQYTHGNFTVASQEVWGQLHVETTWASVTDVQNFLGFTASGDELTFLTTCTDAANDRCWYYRARAGYEDHPNVSPGSDVKLAVILYASGAYRERGSIDSFASFDSMTVSAPTNATLGRVLQLLGCKRPQVG
jgi:hypothetical protein